MLFSSSSVLFGVEANSGRSWGGGGVGGGGEVGGERMPGVGVGGVQRGRERERGVIIP